ncbi:MAG: hypothetical protein JWM40_1667 [Frankiales bacterium]|nr:hypothetical protein [Frankiales bacterium]
MSDWEYFRTTGSEQQVELALAQLRAHGWEVLDQPEPGPLDTWVVRVRRSTPVLA